MEKYNSYVELESGLDIPAKEMQEIATDAEFKIFKQFHQTKYGRWEYPDDVEVYLYKLEGRIIAHVVVKDYDYEGTRTESYIYEVVAETTEDRDKRLARDAKELLKRRKEIEKKKLEDQKKTYNMIEELKKKGYKIEQESDTPKSRARRSATVNLPSKDGSSNC